MPSPDAGWLNHCPPPAAALHLEQVVDRYSRDTVLGMLRHPSNPFVARPRATLPARQEREFQAVGHAYLLALSRLLPDAKRLMPPEVLACLDPDSASSGQTFGWLALRPASDKSPDDHPKGSFWVRRRLSQGGEPVDASLVLLAGRSHAGWLLGDDIGLRLVMHCQADGSLHIHGVTLASLNAAQTLAGVGLTAQGQAGDAVLQRIKAGLAKFFRGTAELSVEDLEIEVQGLTPVARGGEAVQLRVSGEVIRRPADPDRRRPASLRSRVYRFAALLDNDFAPAKLLYYRLNLAQARPAAAPPVSVATALFETDLAARGSSLSQARRRPTRKPEVLDPLRQAMHLPIAADGTLAWSDRQGKLFEVKGRPPARAPALDNGAAAAARTSAVPDRPAVPTYTLTASSAAPVGPEAASRQTSPVASKGNGPLRAIRTTALSDDDAALHAYLRGLELFGRLTAYGLQPRDYFRFAELPLVLRVRAALPDFPEGDELGAEVRPFFGARFTLRQTAGALHRRQQQLLVKFGSAAAAQRQRPPFRATGTSAKGQAAPHPSSTYTKPEYLGVATDPRWAWHEFGHVLNFASTGALEFEFAHSAGDALGAIISDPESAFANDAEARFASYPWVEVPGRRHDRSPWHGYCWCGERNRPRLLAAATHDKFQHGYFEEQLLSTSLFRLYRCLGGDTRDDTSPQAAAAALATRLEAADYAVYLIMRAIALLGPDNIATARTPDQFVSALIDADMGTGNWQVVADWPRHQQTARHLKRLGGLAPKAIRWAFEQQGLYAADDPRAIAEGVGRPPPVDVFIADRRRLAQGQFDGGYWPVPLGLQVDALWLAAPQAVSRSGDLVTVEVGNRGSQAAHGLTVFGWFRGRTDRAWQPLRATSDMPRTGLLAQEELAPAQSRRFCLETPDGQALPPAIWVLAGVDADADRCHFRAQGATPPDDPSVLTHWVALDNNLALTFLP